MPIFFEGHLRPDSLARIPSEDMVMLLKEDYISVLPHAIIQSLPLLSAPVMDLARPEVYGTNLKLLGNLETELKKLRTSWDNLWRLTSAQSCRISKSRYDFPYEAIKMYQKGIRDATNKGGQAIRDNDFQILEESATNLRCEVMRLGRPSD
ncbi:MAG: hypothetical protein Q9169_000784 [Polycauliona sp. 2 TL-2023]